MTVTVHRGTRQIGGCCTEIATTQARILIDAGAPLPGEGGTPLCLPQADAVLVTHYHGDHTGELGNLPEGVPIYMVESCRQILQKYRERMGAEYCRGVNLDEVHTFQNGMPFQIGDIRVTAIESDHSSFQPVMYLLEADGKRVLHTGDFRLHGPHREQLMDALHQLGHIDLLIAEGTSLTRSDGWTEERAGAEMAKLIRQYKYCFLLTASGNLDRIDTFSRQIPKGKYFLMDDFQKDLVGIARAHNKTGRYHLEKPLSYGKNIEEKVEKRGFGMVIRANPSFKRIVSDYVQRFPDDTCLIYSMWSGYRELDEIRNFLALFGKNVRTIHSSGHVTAQSLEDFITELEPEKILVIHTQAKPEDIAITYKDRLLTVSDGEAVCL